MRGAVGGNAATLFRKGLKWKDFVDRGYVVAGSPATVRDKLSWILKDLRVGQLMTLQQIGSMPKHLVLKNTELFAREVMPSLKTIWTALFCPNRPSNRSRKPSNRLISL